MGNKAKRLNRHRQDQRSNVLRIACLHRNTVKSVLRKYEDLTRRDFELLACADSSDRLTSGEYFSIPNVMEYYGLTYRYGVEDWVKRMIGLGYVIRREKKRRWAEPVRYELTGKAHYALKYYSRTILQRLDAMRSAINQYKYVKD